MSKTQLLTIGSIARRLKVHVHQIEYIMRSRDIKEIGWAGNARVYDDKALETIASELKTVKAYKSHTHRSR